MSAPGLAMRLGTAGLACATLILPAATQATAATTTAAHKGILPPRSPSKSLRPRPFFLGSYLCYPGRDGKGCNAMVLKAIAHARHLLERMGGMSFSLSGYEKLSPIEQLFVTANLERTARGLRPATVLSRSLDKVAQRGANRDEDPPLGRVPRRLPGGGQPIGFGGNWAGGWDNALGADYGWMYDDGPGSDNADCTRRNRSGCWGHRDNILGTFNTRWRCGGERNELAMGAGHVRRGKAYGDSETELFVGVCGRTPTDVVLTWARARRLLHIK